MPSWKIHSYIGNQVNKTIKVNKKYFMIGNLLPDQDRYNIENLKRNIPRTTTHFIKREDYLIGINLIIEIVIILLLYIINIKINLKIQY